LPIKAKPMLYLLEAYAGWVVLALVALLILARA
jgi:hypothetical protein